MSNGPFVYAYFKLFEVRAGLARLDLDKILHVKDKLASRWSWFQRPLHMVSHILHPLWRFEFGIIFPVLQFE